MATANRLKMNDAKVQENLKTLDINSIIEVHGTLSYGDPINLLEGDRLQKKIEAQEAKGRPKKCIKREPHVSFSITDVTVPLTGNGGKPANAFEALVNQKVLTWEKDGKTVTSLEEEVPFKIATIGYRSGDKLIPLKKGALDGQRLAYGQGLTITYELYKRDDDIYIGVANLIFDKKPVIFQQNNDGSRLGAKPGQNWATEAEDFDVESAETAAPESVAEEPAEESTGNVWA